MAAQVDRAAQMAALPVSCRLRLADPPGLGAVLGLAVAEPCSWGREAREEAVRAEEVQGGLAGAVVDSRKAGYLGEGVAEAADVAAEAEGVSDGRR